MRPRCAPCALSLWTPKTGVLFLPVSRTTPQTRGRAPRTGPRLRSRAGPWARRYPSPQRSPKENLSDSRPANAARSLKQKWWLGGLVAWVAGLLGCWVAGLLGCLVAWVAWLLGLLGCWVAWLVGCWVAGLLGCWVAGLLGCLVAWVAWLLGLLGCFLLPC